jgi:hypothetical protein
LEEIQSTFESVPQEDIVSETDIDDVEEEGEGECDTVLL